MWIRLSRNTNDISVEMQGMSLKDLAAFARNKENMVNLLTGAHEAAEAVWKVRPDFKTVTLDTLSKEEMDLLEFVKHQKGGQS